MKKLLISILFIIVSSNSFAFHEDWREIRPYLNMTPTWMSATVFNNSDRPIVCRGKVFGQVYSGHVLYSYHERLIVPAGQHRELYVYTNNFNPFVRGNSEMFCRFKRHRNPHDY